MSSTEAFLLLDLCKVIVGVGILGCLIPVAQYCRTRQCWDWEDLWLK